MSDVRRAMSAVNKSNCFDYYGINMKMLYNIRKSIEPILLNLINLSIYNSEFPSVLKISKIIPIPKDKDFLNPKNYRAINIFNPISKIIEKCWSYQINQYLEDNNFLTENHQGGIKSRGTVTATININSKINSIRDNKKIAAVIGLDQSSCFEIINHELLLLKMKHIGFSTQTVNLINQFLIDRKQFTEINTKNSDLLIIGNQSVFQGSILSVVFYNIFTLDIPFIPHKLPAQLSHNSHYKYFKCKNPFLVSYIDDLFAVIEGDDNNIWIKIKEYITTMKDYYTSNKLKINIDKSQIMLSGNRNKIKGSINIDGKTITNKSSMKILGTIFSDDSKFNNNVTYGTNSLLTQLKRRSAAIIRISKPFSLAFKTQLIHTLLIGKIRFNIQTWGNLNVELKYRINKVICKTVDSVTNNIWFGKDTKWKMDKLKIPSFYKIFYNSCYSQTYNFLNTNTNNMMNFILTKNININLLSQNKCSSFNNDEFPSYLSKLSFEHLMRDKYNKLPRGLTLSTSKPQFKKWLNIYSTMNEFDRFLPRIDNTRSIFPKLSHQVISYCSH